MIVGLIDDNNKRTVIVRPDIDKHQHLLSTIKS